MLTHITLEGPMGQKFGRQWDLDVGSPAEALRLIDANVGGLKNWIRSNLQLYSRYRVICEYEDGRTEHLSDETFPLTRKLKSVCFAPIIEGAGGLIQMLVGAALMVASTFGMPYLFQIGASMMLSGLISALSPQPSNAPQTVATNTNLSNYFNGPVNTVTQGVPVQLIYGRVLAGSHPISAAVTIDQVLDGSTSSVTEVTDAIPGTLALTVNDVYTNMFGGVVATSVSGVVSVAGGTYGNGWKYSSDNGTTWHDGAGTFPLIGIVSTTFTLALGTYASGAVQVKQVSVHGVVGPVSSLNYALTVTGA